MKFCSYYQAHIDIPKTWFFVAMLRSHEHVAFDRTIDTKSGLFEFFVPEDTEHLFHEFIAYFQKEGIVSNLVKLENRLANLKTAV